jgi:hypothetical protein
LAAGVSETLNLEEDGIMKKALLILGIALLALWVVSCAEDEGPVAEISQSESGAWTDLRKCLPFARRNN